MLMYHSYYNNQVPVKGADWTGRHYWSVTVPLRHCATHSHVQVYNYNADAIMHLYVVIYIHAHVHVNTVCCKSARVMSLFTYKAAETRYRISNVN